MILGSAGGVERSCDENEEAAAIFDDRENAPSSVESLRGFKKMVIETGLSIRGP